MSNLKRSKYAVSVHIYTNTDLIGILHDVSVSHMKHDIRPFKLLRFLSQFMSRQHTAQKILSFEVRTCLLNK